MPPYFLIVFRSEANEFVVLVNLPWQFPENLCGKFNPVIVVLLKLYKLNQIPLSGVAFSISHVAVVIIELVHDLPAVLALPNPNYNDTQGEFTALYEQVEHFFFVVNVAVSQDEQNHILLTLLLHAETHIHSLPEKGSEVGWT